MEFERKAHILLKETLRNEQLRENVSYIIDSLRRRMYRKDAAGEMLQKMVLEIAIK